MTTSNLGSEGFKFFVGIVEDLNDPLMLGRVKVRAFQEHDENVSTEDLPWAILIVPPTNASSNSIGISPTGITIGSYVFGFFIDGNEKQFPAILGTWHKIPDMDFNKHDVSSLARGTQSIIKTLIGSEPKSSYNAQYPYNKVYQSLSGHVVEIDDTPNSERIQVYHKSGTYIEINKDGQFVAKTNGNDYKIIANNSNVYVGGKANVEIVGDINCTIKGNSTINATGNVELNSSKNVKIKAKKISFN